MADTKVFYRSKIEIIVLSEYPIDSSMDITEIAHEATVGDFVMDVTGFDSEQIDGPQAAEELVKMGSEPGFFMLDEHGQLIEW